VAGIVQIFWVLPMIKRWGRIWYIIGVAGTAILVGIWVITRIPENPITGRGGPISEIAIAIEVLQIVYIVTTLLIMSKEKVKGRYIK
jgi:hypothetical protein